MVFVNKDLCNFSFTMVVIAIIGFALKFVFVGAIGELDRVRIAVTMLTKSLTWICTIASTVLELAMVWIEPRQDLSAVALVSTAFLSFGAEDCSTFVLEMVVIEARLVIIGSVIILVLDVAVEASGNA